MPTALAPLNSSSSGSDDSLIVSFHVTLFGFVLAICAVSIAAHLDIKLSSFTGSQKKKVPIPKGRGRLTTLLNLFRPVLLCASS
jgi:hypothetical protein